MLADRWAEGEDRVWRFIDPATGKVLGEVRSATGHTGAWTFQTTPGSIGICGNRDLAMHFVEDRTLLIGEAKTEEPD
jgi:hypothetical protein